MSEEITSCEKCHKPCQITHIVTGNGLYVVHLLDMPGGFEDFIKQKKKLTSVPVLRYGYGHRKGRSKFLFIYFIQVRSGCRGLHFLRCQEKSQCGKCHIPFRAD